MDDPVAHAEGVIRDANALDVRITEKTERLIGDLVAYQDRDRRTKRIMAVLIAVMLVMLVIGTFAVIKIRDNASTITASCHTTNQANANQIKLWQFILNIPPDPAETPQQKETKTAFAALVQDTFKPLDCSQPKVLP